MKILIERSGMEYFFRLLDEIYNVKEKPVGVIFIVERHHVTGELTASIGTDIGGNYPARPVDVVPRIKIQVDPAVIDDGTYCFQVVKQIKRDQPWVSVESEVCSNKSEYFEHSI